MSFLLDALNKTNASASPAEELSVSDEAQNDEKLHSESEHKPSTEPYGDPSLALELETALQLETELDAELSIDESALNALIDEHPADHILETTIELAAEQAVEEASHQVRTESSHSVGSTIESSESYVPPFARMEGPGATASGLIIEAEPETLTEEVLQDAPLVAAYAKAQRRRKWLILSALGLFISLLCAFVYKTVFYAPSTNGVAMIMDPVINVVEDVPLAAVALEAIELSQIPARRKVPSGEPNIPVNRVQVTSQPSSTDAFARAYQAMDAGQLNKASNLFTRMLENPVSRADALAGQASVLIAQKNISGAKKRLNELLALDSNNIYAQSVLATMPTSSTERNADIDNKTSLLKSLLYSNPNNASIAYMLGNQLATELKWPEAQNAYFTAYSLNSENAVYALNLAVSLDRLGKHQQARKFYTTALRNASKARVKIDVDAISRRLQQGN